LVTPTVKERHVLAHGRLDAVDRGHDVLTSSEQGSVVVREHRGHGIEVKVFDRVERGTLNGETR
jgi:hypothetical protein